MSIDQFLIAARARWKLAIGTMLVIAAAALAISLLLPARYTATASVLVDVKSTDPVSNTSVNPQMLLPLMANEANILQSERVMLQAIDDLHLLDNAEYKAKWQKEAGGEGEYPVWLATYLQRDLEIKPAHDGTVINVQFTADDRGFAAKVANGIVKAYVDTSITMRTEPAQKFVHFFDDRVKSSREALEAAQRRLAALQQSKGLVVTDEKLDVESARLLELSAELTSLQAAVSESSSRQRESTRQGESSPEAQASPVVAQLNATLAQQQARLGELESRLSDNHPQIIEAKAAIAQTQASLRAATQKVVRGLSVPNDVNRSRLGETSSALAAQRAKLLQLKGDRDAVTVLQRDVDNAQRAYDESVNKLNQSSLESQTKQTNVSMLKTASPPPKPSSPKIFLNTAVALVLGALLGLGAVYFRELSDRRLRSTEDIVSYLGHPMLGILPDTGPSARPSPLRAMLGNFAPKLGWDAQ